MCPRSLAGRHRRLSSRVESPGPRPNPSRCRAAPTRSEPPPFARGFGNSHMPCTALGLPGPKISGLHTLTDRTRPRPPSGRRDLLRFEAAMASAKPEGRANLMIAPAGAAYGCPVAPAYGAHAGRSREPFSHRPCCRSLELRAISSSGVALQHVPAFARWATPQVVEPSGIPRPKAKPLALPGRADAQRAAAFCAGIRE
jgi:hypothetical protein